MQPRNDTHRRLRARLPDPTHVERPWLSSYPAGVPQRYDYPVVPFTRLLDDAAQDFPETAAVAFGGYRLTYRDLVDRVDRFATALAGLGIRQHDRVGLMLPPCPQHVVAFFAVLRLGATVVEHRPDASADRLEREVNDAGCRAVVCVDDAYEALAALKGRLPSVRHVIATATHDALPFPHNVVGPLLRRSRVRIPATDGVHRFTDLVHRCDPAILQAPVDPTEDVAVLRYTAGRGVMLTHGNLVANAFQARLWIPDVQAGRENLLIALSPGDAYGLTGCLGFGVLSAATLTVVPSPHPRSLLDTIHRFKPTLLIAGSATLDGLGAVAGTMRRDLSSIRVAAGGASPLPDGVAKRLEELTGGRVREGYGLVEASALTHANPVYGRAKPGWAGLPVTDTVGALVDGELVVAGPQVARGYWNRPEETAATFKDGWLLTGVMAEIDDDGYFRVVGRKEHQ